MTNHELITYLAGQTGLSKRRVENLLDELTTVIGDNMVKGNKTAIARLGVFHPAKRAARRGVDPHRGNEIQIPEMKMPGVRFSIGLKRKIRG